MATLYSFMDHFGNLLEVEEILIPGVGLGLIIHTTHRGPCIPLEEVPRLTQALMQGLHMSPTQERHSGNSNGSRVGTGQ
jgi:hypothetical protein